jgi:hypothetical protein
MLTLEQTVVETASIFEKELVIPIAPIKFKDQIEALEQSNLPRQRSACIHDMRRWQAKEMGFKELTDASMIEMLMGESHTDHKNGDKHKIEWLYNHHTGNVGTTWTSVATIYYRQERAGAWHLPPFAKQIKWEVQDGKLDYLKREIPYGVILKINELKNLKIFNSFGVMAPKDAWFTQKEIDPIVYGLIYQLPPDDENNHTAVGSISQYFIAKW